MITYIRWLEQYYFASFRNFTKASYRWATCQNVNTVVEIWRSNEWTVRFCGILLCIVGEYLTETRRAAVADKSHSAIAQFLYFSRVKVYTNIET